MCNEMNFFPQLSSSLIAYGFSNIIIICLQWSDEDHPHPKKFYGGRGVRHASSGVDRSCDSAAEDRKSRKRRQRPTCRQRRMRWSAWSRNRKRRASAEPKIDASAVSTFVAPNVTREATVAWSSAAAVMQHVIELASRGSAEAARSHTIQSTWLTLGVSPAPTKMASEAAGTTAFKRTRTKQTSEQ